MGHGFAMMQVIYSLFPDLVSVQALLTVLLHEQIMSNTPLFMSQRENNDKRNFFLNMTLLVLLFNWLTHVFNKVMPVKWPLYPKCGDYKRPM